MTGYTFNQLFDFTRTTAGTFVGSNGLIQTTPASINVLTFTQEFDNAAWVKAAMTVTANTTVAPDNTSTADKLVATAAAGGHSTYRGVTLTSGVSHTLSFYVKAAEYSKVYIVDVQNGRYNCTFDLAAGTAGTPGGSYTGKSAAITNVGNGWYRCELSFTPTATEVTAPSVVGYPDTGATLNNFGVSYTGDGTSGIFAWGAQLELGSTATAYTRNNGGLFPPRFEYDPVTLAPRGILIEEQRTNLILQSNSLTAAAGWANLSAGLAVAVANDAQAPDGTNTATRLTFGGTNTFWGSNVPSVAGTTYAGSVWIKTADGGADFTIQLSHYPTGGGTTIDVTVNVTSSWTRVNAIFTTVTVGPGASYLVLRSNTTRAVHVWGAQFEAGAFATSYIPTVASQVTRTADVCTISAPMFAPWYNQNEGTWAFDFVSPVAGDRTAVNPSDGTNNNRMTIGFTASSPNNLAVFTGGALQALIGAGTQVPGVPSKMAAAYRLNDFASTTNGAVPATDTSGTVPTVNQLNVGSLAIGGALNGHIRRVQFYPFRASNNQLQALST